MVIVISKAYELTDWDGVRVAAETAGAGALAMATKARTGDDCSGLGAMPYTLPPTKTFWGGVGDVTGGGRGDTARCC